MFESILVVVLLNGMALEFCFTVKKQQIVKLFYLCYILEKDILTTGSFFIRS